MKIYLKEFMEHYDYLAKLNRSNILNLELYDSNNKRIKLDKDKLLDHGLTGLNNRDFITMYFFNS